MELSERCGNIDVYWFDQLLKGRVPRGAQVLDAGCGAGRNLVYLLREGYDVHGVDQSQSAIAQVQALAVSLQDGVDAKRFRREAVEAMSFEDASMDVVICNAVLHFARDHAHFRAMLMELWRVLRPGGMLFIRVASTDGLDGALQPRGGGRYLLPDGSERYLLDPATRIASEQCLGAQPLEPWKSTLVAGLRSMGTWVLRSPKSG